MLRLCFHQLCTLLYVSNTVSHKESNNYCIRAMLFTNTCIFVFATLYSLVIGSASVVSSVPLAILSLAPSIILSLIAFVIIKTILIIAKKEDETELEIDSNIANNEEQSD